MRNFEETEQWASGQRSQEAIEKVLAEEGCWYQKSYRIQDPDNPGAPCIHIGEFKIVLPDLDVVKGGERFWLEVKGKTRPVFFRNAQQERHGVDRWNWNAYRTLEREMKTRVYLAVHEQQRGNILVQSMETLAKNLIHGDESAFGRQMVFFPRSVFELWATDGQGEMFRFTRDNWMVNDVKNSARGRKPKQAEFFT